MMKHVVVLRVSRENMVELRNIANQSDWSPSTEEVVRDLMQLGLASRHVFVPVPRQDDCATCLLPVESLGHLTYQEALEIIEIEKSLGIGSDIERELGLAT